MHVRIAWEILYHQKKQNPDGLSGNQTANASAGSTATTPGGSTSVASSSGNSAAQTVTVTQSGAPAQSPLGAGPSPSVVSSLSMKASPALSLGVGPSPHLMHRPGELPPGAYALPGRSPFETSPLSASFIGAPPSHIGKQRKNKWFALNFNFNNLHQQELLFHLLDVT